MQETDEERADGARGGDESGGAAVARGARGRGGPVWRRGETVEVEIESLAYGGRGVGRLEGLVAFVEGAVPGDRVAATVLKSKKSHLECRTTEVLRAGAGRREAPCVLFGRCGGCTWQNLDDAAQLQWKDRQVREALSHLGGITLADDVFLPPVAAPAAWHYRNKMEFGFGLDRDGATRLGFHEKGNYRHILDVERCHIHPEPFDALLGEARAWATEHELTGYDPRRHTGTLRHLTLRRSEATGEIMALLLTSSDERLPGGGLEALAARMKRAAPDLAGMVHGVNAGMADAAYVDRVVEQWGVDRFIERLGGRTFRVSITSFFQTNTRGAERLYEAVAEAADLPEGATLLDAFCGAGTIGLYLADRLARLYGIELIESAVADARRNAELNGLAARAEFWAGDVRDLVPRVRERAAVEGRAIDCVVIDPPRGGMHAKALAAVLAVDAPRFVYVSCNPTTMARDMRDILAAGYGVRSVRTVDMFPQTYHIEAVIGLERAGAAPVRP